MQAKMKGMKKKEREKTCEEETMSMRKSKSESKSRFGPRMARSSTRDWYWSDIGKRISSTCTQSPRQQQPMACWKEKEGIGLMSESDMKFC